MMSKLVDVVLVCLLISVTPVFADQWVCERTTGKWHVYWRDSRVFLSNSKDYVLVKLPGRGVPDPIRDRCDWERGRNRAATPAEQEESQRDYRRVTFDQDPDSARLFQALIQAVYELKSAGWTQAEFVARVRQLYINTP